MANEQNSAKSNSGHKAVIGIVVVLLIIVAILLLLFLRCDKPSAIDEEFDYFRAKASELAFDRGRIIEFVQKDIILLPYSGDVKGALGALWGGAGSAGEKLALAKALLACCKPGSPSVDVSLDDVVPDRDKAPDAAKGKRYALSIIHRLLMPGNAAPKETSIYDGHIGDFVGNVHSLDVPECGRTRFTIRVDSPVVKEVSAIGGMGEEVVFKIEQPGGKSLTVVREFWRADNRVGALFPLKGDRHDFVVLPCRISKYVFDKETMLVKVDERDKSDEGKHYLGLLEYCLDSDRRLEKIEAGFKVRATFRVPRIIFLSKYNIPDGFGGPAYSFDLRMNRAGFALGERMDAYLAEQARSFHESGIEHVFLKRWTGKSVTSAFDVFCRLKDDYPNHPAGRMKIISDALRIFQTKGSADGSVTFKAILRPVSGNAPEGKASAQVRITKTGAGIFRISGDSLAKELADFLKERELALPIEQGKLSGEIKDISSAALAVENGLLASAVPGGVPVDYVLETKIDCGTEPIFVPGTVYKMFIAPSGTHSIFRFKKTKGDLSFDFKVWSSSQTIPGSLTITEKARKEAIDYHTWWHDDTRTYDDKVSLILPRKVYDNIKAGKAGEYISNGKADEKKTIEPKSTGHVTVKINGRDMKLPVIVTMRGNTEIKIYDDPDMPIVGFNFAEYITTPVKCRLVDENGFGISNARVELVGAGVSETTWPDGGFRLPSAPDKVYGKVKMKVTRNDEVYGEAEVDLSAPGLDTIVVTVPRKRMHVIWLAPGDSEKTAEINLSEQVLRHIRNHLDAGEYVAVPERMVPYGESATIAFFAYDTPSGHVMAVSEDGLHQSTTGLRDKFSAVADAGSKLKDAVKDPKGVAKGVLKDGAKKGIGFLIDKAGLSEEDAGALNSLAEIIIESEGQFGMIETLHAYRGSLAALFGYSRHRIGQEDKTDHNLAIKNTLKEMEALANATDLFKGIDDLAGGAASAGMSKTPWGAIGGEKARAAFKFGYLTALKHIDLEFGK